ncbi:carbon-phosphorus lyase complex subunit PhnI [Salinicoccus cyprini]|uniref:Carbon-phosphorus lyase complex subunit PhnI n=1 Tax=Salinicoccus cyprini TaxID=2493691 RepID=A0A558AXI0_9STAP|nr:carbon-phosphorus lyase complex subunit PhnI [Salinicoccus cyprini]TVT28966.1 carbon-phosphorus lyase complex subunit PhnI [Salinicoccus cyprini]
MGYVAVKGGTKAIQASVRMYKDKQHAAGYEIEVEHIKANMNQLINQIMSEASLYDRDLAALSILQAEGNMEEAVFLLRAHRSTLPRLHYSTVTNTRDMFVERRVSASFKDIPGGQILGASPDFTHRLLDDDQSFAGNKTAEAYTEIPHTHALDALPKVIDYLEQEGLFSKKPEDDREPDDITKQSIEFPSSRSERLQSLTRGQTGAVTSLGYAEIRGYGYSSHPNIGEVRVGQQPVHIDPFDTGDAYYIGDIELTEVEAFMPADEDDMDDLGNTEKTFKIGYGLTFGQNETKAIAMSVLDYSLEHPVGDAATSDDEFVLLHIDSVESTGFISHLKLPHYVTFQSVLDRVRQTKGEHGQ